MTTETFNAEAAAGIERGIVPTGTYLVKMHVEFARRGLDGEILTGEDDLPEKLLTKNNTVYWVLQNTILEGPYAGTVVFDSLYFDPAGSGIKRVVWLAEAVGAIPTRAECAAHPELLVKRTNAEIKPEDFEGVTFLMVVDKSGESTDAEGNVRTGRNGQTFMDCRVAFKDGYRRIGQEAPPEKARTNGRKGRQQHTDDNF